MDDSLHDLRCSEDFKPTVAAVGDFITQHIAPVSDEFFATPNEENRWALSDRQTEILEGLKAKAKDAGFWNFFLPTWNGDGISNLDYAYLAEQMGRNPMSSEVFNCAAPDTGNMEVLERYGSEQHKQEWLEPLLDGKIRSCYSMTEPHRASSDAANITHTVAVKDGDDYVVSGEKFYISGAGDTRCKVQILMACTDPEGPKHKRHTMFCVPMDTPGIEVLGPMHVFGHDGAPHGHMHIKYDKARLSSDMVILGEGRGFEVAQGRLGPGRIHHCMRSIGQAEKALELMITRGLSRKAFGKEIIKLGGNFDVVARSRNEIDMMRLMVLKTAKAMDVLGNQEARTHISQIKAIIPEMVCTIIDRSIQLHGATGISQWTPLAAMYTGARTLRFADGPDEVHRMVVARNEIRKYEGLDA